MPGLNNRNNYGHYFGTHDFYFENKKYQFGYENRLRFDSVERGIAIKEMCCGDDFDMYFELEFYPGGGLNFDFCKNGELLESITEMTDPDKTYF